MPKSNQNKQAKRKRELAKKDKRDAKDQKRAVLKEEARTERGDAPVTATPVPQTAQQRWSAPKPVVKPGAKSKLSTIAAATFIRSMKIQGR